MPPLPVRPLPLRCLQVANVPGLFSGLPEQTEQDHSGERIKDGASGGCVHDIGGAYLNNGSDDVRLLSADRSTIFDSFSYSLTQQGVS